MIFMRLEAFFQRGDLIGWLNRILQGGLDSADRIARKKFHDGAFERLKRGQILCMRADIVGFTTLCK